MQRTSGKLLLSCFAVLLAACETVRTAPDRGGDNVSTQSVLPVPSSRAGQGDGAVLLAIEFKGLEGGESACRWRMINQTSGKSFFITLKTTETNVFGQLDPGTYKPGRLGCGISRIWELDDVYKEGFVVEPGRTSYIGKLIFEFKSGKLDVIRKAQRDESARAFLTAVDATPAGGMETISGFTGKPIRREMLDANEPREGFDVFAVGVESAQTTLQPLMNALRTCAKDEGVSDPVRFGRLEYIAVYKQGRFIEMKNREEANAFSDRLRSCVERGIMAFHPPPKNSVEVRVRY